MGTQSAIKKLTWVPSLSTLHCLFAFVHLHIKIHMQITASLELSDVHRKESVQNKLTPKHMLQYKIVWSIPLALVKWLGAENIHKLYSLSFVFSFVLSVHHCSPRIVFFLSF